MSDENEYKLQRIEINRERWGENKGQLTGKIQFMNGKEETFVFTLSQEQVEPYIRLISEQVVRSASELGQQLIKTLGLEK